MKITRNLTTIEFSEFENENLCAVITLLNNLKKSLQEHGEDCIQNIVDGRGVDMDELDDVIYYLKFFANVPKFIVE